MSPQWPLSNLVRAMLAAVVMFMTIGVASAQTFKVLYSFTGGADGGGLAAGVVMDKTGNLYGTTSGGGAYNDGTVFELSPNSDGTWAESVLHSFANGDPDGQNPQSTLVIDAAGNLYGTAASGGAYNGGTAFELTPNAGIWTLSVLFSFGGYVGDTNAPPSGMVLDSHGSLYGGGIGGTYNSGGIVELSPGASGWTENVLFSFGANGLLTGGFDPFGQLLLDPSGDIYGATIYGGSTSGWGCGVIYGLRKVSGVWTESLLHTFGTVHGDGCAPENGQLAFDSKGNLYGTTALGGDSGCNPGASCGTIFRVSRKSGNRAESIIHRFGTGAEGAVPVSWLTFDAAGNVYGTTRDGGGPCDCGVVFKLSPTSKGGWVYSVLHPFSYTDGGYPIAGLILDSSGNLYGTTELGGPGGYGVVFEITP
jgi:uncharacterized repeat protein (TIGR03803 family)